MSLVRIGEKIIKNMKLESALDYKKEISEVFEDYSYIREVVDLERPFYIWAEEPGGDIPYTVIDTPNPNIKITNIVEKEKLILLVAMYFGIKHCMYVTEDLDSYEETNGKYMGNAYYLTDYMFMNPLKFDNKFLKKGDFIKRWKNLKLFLENNFPNIKKNTSWKYIKRLKVENYEIVLLLVCIPINNNIEYF